MKKLIFLVALFMISFNIYTQNSKTAYGYLSQDRTETRKGLISFPIDNPSASNLFHSFNDQYEVSAGAYHDGFLYVFLYKLDSFIGYHSQAFGKINMDTYEFTKIADMQNISYVLGDMTYDNKTNSMYYVTNTSPENKFGKIDIKSGAITPIITSAEMLATIACDNNGKIYIITYDGELGIMSPEGDFSAIGHTGQDPYYFQSMYFDIDDNSLYWAMCGNSESKFLKVNTTDASTISLGVLGNNSQITGLYIPPIPAPNGTPNIVTNFMVTTNNTLSAVINFNAPTTTVDGLNLTNINKIEIFRDKNLIHTFTNPTPNELLSYTDNGFTEKGLYAYKIIATNDVGTGAPKNKIVFVGEDLPAAPNNIVLEKDGKDAKITWEVVTSGINDGWIDASSLQYKIKRMPDNVELATISQNSYTDNSLSVLNNYQYIIQSITDLGDGGEASSNSLEIGPSYQIPYKCTFEQESEFNQWKVIDGNNDANTWEYKLYRQNVEYSMCNLQADDWLISPAIYLMEGKEYRIKFDSQVLIEGSERLKLFYGKGNNVENQNIELGSFTIDNPSYNTKTITFTVESTGEYNFGFYIWSRPISSSCSIKNIKIDLNTEKDFEVTNIIGNLMPMVGKSSDYSITIKNNGIKPQLNYKVQLIDANDNILAEQSIDEQLGVDVSKEVILTYTPTIAAEMKIRAKVVLDGDELSVNDYSKWLTLNVQELSIDEWKLIGKGDYKGEEYPLTYLPISLFFRTAASQMIFTSEDLGTSGGIIKSIVFPYNNKNSAELINKQIKVYIQNTDKTELSESYWIQPEEFKLVFDGNIEFNKGEGEMSIELTSPFIYSGGNICMMFFSDLDENFYPEVEFVFSSKDCPRSHMYGSFIEPLTFIPEQTGMQMNVTPDFRMKIQTGDGGSLQGNIKDINSQPLNNVLVTINELGINTKSDELGNYIFNFLPEGEYTLTATLHGYSDQVSTKIIEIDSQIVCDFILNYRPKYNVSGKIKDADNNTVDHVKIKITGYEEYETETLSDGTFILTNIYVGNQYMAKISKLNLTTKYINFDVVDSDVNLGEIMLNDTPNQPFAITAVANERNVELKWDKPEAQFRYDDGIVQGGLGLTGNVTNNTVMGSVHLTPGILNSISWITLSDPENGLKHQTVNVFVFDLDSHGKPTSNVLFSQANVINFDDQWTTFKFPSPITAPNGFMIALSYEGFLNIGHDSGSNIDWPFVPNVHYYADNYKNGQFELQPDGYKVNLMIRASGNPIYKSDNKIVNFKKNYNTSFSSTNSQYTNSLLFKNTNNRNITNLPVNKSSRSFVGYKVWRFIENNQNNESKWTLLTQEIITDEQYTDNNWETLPNGLYKYAVKAYYSNNIISEATISNMVPKGMISTVTIEVATNTPINESTGAFITLKNKDGKKEHVYNGTISTNGKVIIDNVWKGKYKINISLEGFDEINLDNITIDNDIQNLSYSLKEIIVKPFSLEIIKVSESERQLNWNTINYFFDDIENHPDFEINSPGLLGLNYIDGDQAYTCGIGDFSYPNKENEKAAIVFNPEATTPAMEIDEILAHSGNKFLGIFAANEIPNNDWIISPELDFEKDFTFSFWAKSFIDEYGLETINVKYSTSGKAEKDFKHKLNSTEIEVPISWQKYTYTVPKDAKYVAINCNSYDIYLLMVDDLFFGIEPTRSLTNYEVYLNGTLVGQTSNTSYNFSNLENGKYTAGVKSIYSSGPSVISTIDFEVDGVKVENLDKNSIRIFPNPASNQITVCLSDESIDKIEIYNNTGHLCKSYQPANSSINEHHIDIANLPTGVYFIKVYNKYHCKSLKFIKQ